MSEFRYKDTYKEFGRIKYVCECSVCGRDCTYSRKIHTAAVCIPCAKMLAKKKEYQKKEDHDREIYIRAIKRFNNMCELEMNAHEPYKLTKKLSLDALHSVRDRLICEQI